MSQDQIMALLMLLHPVIRLPLTLKSVPDAINVRALPGGCLYSQS